MKKKKSLKFHLAWVLCRIRYFLHNKHFFLINVECLKYIFFLIDLMHLHAARQAGTGPLHIGRIIRPFGISREKIVSDHKMYPVAEKFEFFATPPNTLTLSEWDFTARYSRSYFELRGI